MRHDFLDRYSRIDSPIHRLPAGTKLAIAVAIVLATALTPISVPVYFGVLGIFLVIVAVASRISPLFLAKRLILLEPFVLGVAGLALLQPNGGRVFAMIVIKSTLCLFTMILLSNTTPFAAVVSVLRRIHFPDLLTTTLALMVRYLSVLVDEAERMHRARASRTFVRNRRRLWKTLGTVIGQLFVRSTERAERIHAAMCSRGWK
ncbi:MAG TPA: cobalt ECF transporter T component CbiQ [Verrucomicrobiae bacterium]|nr:cobalt ECF transporter T component CbiQ [Verrucomicrobiae bacterium]